MVKLETLFDLFQGFFVSYNQKTFVINYIQKGNNVIAKNIGFIECMKLLEKENIIHGKNFNTDDLEFFVSNPYISGSFLFPFQKKGDISQYYRVTKKIYDDETVIYLEEFNDRNALSTLSDSLTGVYQRDAIEQFVNNKIKINKNRCFYFMVVDIDFFKQYNDTYGHLIGDEVLKEIAKIFKKIYTNGFVGRVGGDEFVIVDFSTCDKIKIQQKCDLLLKEVSSIKIDEIEGGRELSITGGISFYPEQETYRDLFKKADEKLYIGKKSGKNKFVI